MKPRLPRESDFRGAAHSPRVATRVGLALAVTFGLCFLTGLLSHLIQHPPHWFTWPSRPVSLYRLTQGTHVISGIASIPLLAAKLWSVYPELFTRPALRSATHALERLSVLALVGSALFELVTGLLNVTQNYPWPFFFPPVHYAVGWIAVGSIILHVGLKLPVARAALAPEHPVAPVGTTVSRRAFLRTTATSTGVAVLATAGATIPALRHVSPLKWRSDQGSRGLPVNRTATAAGVVAAATDPDWRLEISTPAGTTSLSRAGLAALPQTTVDLPIACVEGWSRTATWTGVAFTDLLHAIGARPGSEVRVSSLETTGIYSTSVLPGTHTADPLTVLALDLNGAPLDLDHGYPCRVIAPNRPGVLQTKWVSRLETA